MWILYAFASAFFAGVTAVLAKLGMEGVNSHLATALRTNCGGALRLGNGLGGGLQRRSRGT